MDITAKREWFFCELPLTEYKEVWAIQKALVEARKEGRLDRDCLLFVEHLPVYTVGRREDLYDLSVSGTFLESRGIPIVGIERGGKITFHGPGQIVMYPILDLRLLRLRVTEYIGMLEEVMIRTVADFGIEAERNPLNRGIWVGMKKMGSIGIAIRKGISFHGASLNVNVSLEPFSCINPCGLKGIDMTSMQKELSHYVSMDGVREAMKRHVESVFGIGLKRVEMDEIEGLTE